MIPIIFDKTEPSKPNRFQSNGLGRLTDAISCSVTKALDGSQFDLEMEYPVNGVHYEDIKERNYIYCKASQKFGNQPFRIVKVSKPMNGTVSVTAQHVSYILDKTLVAPYRADHFWQETGGQWVMDPECETYRFKVQQGESIASVLEKFVNYIYPSTNSKFTYSVNFNALAGYDPALKDNDHPYGKPVKDWGNANLGELIQFELKTPITVKEFLTGSAEGSINNLFGFKEEFNTNIEVRVDGFNISLNAEIGDDTGVQLRYGKNLTDMTYEVDKDSTYSAIMPFYNGDRDATTVVLPVYNSESAPNDSFMETQLMDLSSDESYTNYINSLDDAGIVQKNDPAHIDYWSKHKLADDKPWVNKENVNVNFINLWETEEYKDVAPLQLLDIGDRVTVVYPDMGVHVTKRVANETWDVLAGRYSAMTLGDLRKDIGDIITDQFESYLGATTEYIDELNTYFTTELTKTAEEIALKADATVVNTLGEVVEEYGSEIRENAEEIALRVRRGDLSSELSMESGQVRLSSNRLVIDSTNFSLDADGNANFSGTITSSRIIGSNIDGGHIVLSDDTSGHDTASSSFTIESTANSGWLAMFRDGIIMVDDVGQYHTNYYTGYMQIQDVLYNYIIRVAATGITQTIGSNSYTYIHSGNWSSYISVPKYTTELTNNSGYITSSDLSGYATQTWVTNQGYVKSSGVTSVSKGTVSTKSSTHMVSEVTVSGSTSVSIGYYYHTDSSDRRLKDNIVPLDDVFNLYMELNPVSFEFKKLKGLLGGTHYGLIAQDVRDALNKYGFINNSIVQENDCSEDLDDELKPYVGNQYYSINYEELHALHIQMIQKQQHEIELLQQEVISLRGEIEILKQLVNSISQ